MSSNKLLGSLRTFLLVTVAAVWLAGCNFKVNEENFNTVELGMDRDAVHKILGKPANVESGAVTVTETWESFGKVIKISYLADRVATKNFSKGE